MNLTKRGKYTRLNILSNLISSKKSYSVVDISKILRILLLINVETAIQGLTRKPT